MSANAVVYVTKNGWVLQARIILQLMNNAYILAQTIYRTNKLPPLFGNRFTWFRFSG